MPEDDLKTDARYIALSHPWGSAQNHNHFCTTRQNLASRIRDGIAMADLPATLRDAVIVTRALGVRYLWIDTICIVQGSDGDFDTEACLMETVFSLAYCVIAASCADGTSSGFLSEQKLHGRRDFVALDLAENNGSPAENTGTPSLYICEAIDDFQRHVIDGPLNQRGWVLQERALARRTIHFTQWQTYFECGAGVRCETLTKMQNNQAAFLGDPNFPTVALQSSKGARIRLYELLYTTYSGLHFTKSCDRSIAIAGLEQRLVKAFDTHGGYGIFDGPFFGRSLLWKRDERVPRNAMRPITFPLHERYYHVPSWSWMAYEGVIAFMEIPFGGVEWQHGNKEGLSSPWTTSLEEDNDGSASSPSGSGVWHTGKANEQTVLKAMARDFSESVSLSEVETKIVYDAGEAPGGEDGVELRCVIVGRQKPNKGQATNWTLLEHYVLVVGRKRASSKNTTHYRRLGVAALPGRWINQNGLAQRISII